MRRVNGHYDLRQLPASPGSNLVSVRAIRGSSFAQQADWLFFAGYDAKQNVGPQHRLDYQRAGGSRDQQTVRNYASLLMRSLSGS